MADNGSFFSLEVFPTGWFAKETQGQGWFDRQFLDPAASGGAANFAGTATIVFGQSGALFAPSIFAGSSSVIFSQTGNLLSSTALSGTTAITFGQSGAITSPATLVGTTPITFDQQGNFNAASGGIGANLVGTGAIQFGQSGNFSTQQDQPATGGSYYDIFNPRKKRRIDDDEDDEKPEPVSIVTLNKADKPIVVEFTPRGPRKIEPFKPRTDVLERFEEHKFSAESNRRKRIRQLQNADDEWLMMM
jgi:hypothetical protein